MAWGVNILRNLQACLLHDQLKPNSKPELKFETPSQNPGMFLFSSPLHFSKYNVNMHTWTLTQTLPTPGFNYLLLSSWAAVGERWFGPACSPNVAGGGPSSGRCPASLGSYCPNTRYSQPQAAPWTWLQQPVPKAGLRPCKANTTNKNTRCTSVSTKRLARVRYGTENLDRIWEERQERLLFSAMWLLRNQRGGGIQEPSLQAELNPRSVWAR